MRSNVCINCVALRELVKFRKPNWHFCTPRAAFFLRIVQWCSAVADSDHLPIPVTAETRPFWDGCAREELLYQFCLGCSRPQFYPRQMCVNCNQDRLEWRKSGKKGLIHSYTVVHRAPTPAFKSEAPYIVGLIDLNEGFRMMMMIESSDASEVRIGKRVDIFFHKRTNGDTIPFATIEK